MMYEIIVSLCWVTVEFNLHTLKTLLSRQY